MKKIISILCLIALNAFSFGIQSLPGKYFPFPGKCDYNLGSVKRIYISSPTKVENYSVLNIKFYGSEASITEVLLGNGIRYTQGTTFQPKPVDKWNQTFNSQVLIVNEGTFVGSKQVNQHILTIRPTNNSQFILDEIETDLRSNQVTAKRHCEFYRAN